MKTTLVFFLTFCVFTFSSNAQDRERLDDPTWMINRIYLDNHHKMSPDSVMEVLLPKIIQERDSIIAKHEHNLIMVAQIQYHYANVLYLLSESIVDKVERDRPWKRLGDEIFHETPLPSEELLTQLSEARMFTANYVFNQLRDVFLRAREEGNQVVEEAIGLPVDSLMKLSHQHGDLILGLLYAKNSLPPSLAPHFLSSHIKSQLEIKNLQLAEIILNELKHHFSSYRALKRAEEEVYAVRMMLENNSSAPDIVFIVNPDSITSVEELLAPFAGKVVYLDFWGTWCGPCLDEIRHHNQALKDHFSEEGDLVFLYLAMEKVENREKWRQFIVLHHLSGHHLSKTSEHMEPFWQELLGTRDVPRNYPTYMIFDRNGFLVNNQALRPSHREALYLQLKEVLDRTF